jgi:hypothetical protein
MSFLRGFFSIRLRVFFLKAHMYTALLLQISMSAFDRNFSIGKEIQANPIYQRAEANENLLLLSPTLQHFCIIKTDCLCISLHIKKIS